MFVESKSFGSIKMELVQKKSWLKSKYDVPISYWQTPLIEKINDMQNEQG